MASVIEIRENLVRLLNHEQSLNAFTDWLTRSTWNIQRESGEVKELAGKIHSVLAEFSNRHISPQQLRRKLSALTAGQQRARPRATRSREKHRA
jgi:hypothetical protein